MRYNQDRKRRDFLSVNAEGHIYEDIYTSNYLRAKSPVIDGFIAVVTLLGIVTLIGALT